jgi:hypothetical protein
MTEEIFICDYCGCDDSHSIKCDQCGKSTQCADCINHAWRDEDTEHPTLTLCDLCMYHDERYRDSYRNLSGVIS